METNMTYSLHPQLHLFKTMKININKTLKNRETKLV